MENKNFIIVDEIKWWIYKNEDGSRTPIPLCPKHHMRLKPITALVKDGNTTRFKAPEGLANVLTCPDCSSHYGIPRNLAEERNYILNKADAQFFKNQKFIDLDDVALPIAKSNFKAGDNKYSASIQVMESKRGLQVVVYAGKKGIKNTQVFVEPETKKMSFDHKDAHPTEIFTEITAKFKDGSSQSIKKNDKNITHPKT